jgi:hypothetical protein
VIIFQANFNLYYRQIQAKEVLEEEEFEEEQEQLGEDLEMLLQILGEDWMVPRMDDFEN